MGKKIIDITPAPAVSVNKKRVAAYARVSCDKDAMLHSLAAQIDYYHSFICNNADWEFVGVYADTGISGTRTKNRAQFLQLIEDCCAGKVDGIITKSVSRFGRNTVDTLVFTRELRSLGIDVFFEKENLHSCSPEGELLLTLMAALAESEAVSMSDNIKWGKRRRYEKGLIESLPIANVYGFCKKDGKIAIEDQEALILKRIYTEFINGYNYADIAAGLTADGVPTRRDGASWASTTVKNFLANEKYCGDCKFQKTFIQDPVSHKSVINRGELPQFLVEECLPVIIDKEMWSVAQNIRMRHSSGRPSPCEEYPFRGMIFCGTCGKPVNIQYTTREGRQLSSAYRCISRKDNSGVEIPGLAYTPPHKSNYTKNPTDALVEYREKYCKKVLPRPLLCSDIQIPVERPQKSFVQVWNLIVAKKARYQATLKRMADITEDVLIRYRANEMYRLLDELGKITEFDYPLMLRTLDRVDTTPDEKLTFLFQSGIRITV
jgi:site-specific DNA recombinase